MFLFFSSKQECQTACNRIFDNINNWLKVNYSIRVSPRGLISLNADGTPNLKATPTVKWADPTECQEGFYIPKPEQEDVGQVPIAVVLEGVGGTELAEVTAIVRESP